jgi:hypothetical protein
VPSFAFREMGSRNFRGAAPFFRSPFLINRPGFPSLPSTSFCVAPTISVLWFPLLSPGRQTKEVSNAMEDHNCLATRQVNQLGSHSPLRGLSGFLRPRRHRHSIFPQPVITTTLHAGSPHEHRAGCPSILFVSYQSPIDTPATNRGLSAAG